MEMTGRDLIMYILENKLEDKPVYKDGDLLGFITVAKAAELYGVGESSIKVMISQGRFSGIRVNDAIYIPVTEVQLQ